MPSKKNAVTVDPSLYMDRLLHYQEKHSGWMIFQSVYWGIYLIIAAVLLLYYGQLSLTVPIYFGIMIFVLAIMVIIHGFATSLHLKLMRRYG